MSLWRPRSPCGPGCRRRPGTTPTVHIGVRCGRLAAVLGVVGAAVVLLPFVPARRRGALVRWWARRVLRALGIRRVVRGSLPRRGALLVANHVSWVDTLAILAHTPARLVAKREVRGWPVIGALAAAGGSLFLDRSRPRTLPSTVADVAAALRAGSAVAVFPEGRPGAAGRAGGSGRRCSRPRSMPGRRWYRSRCGSTSEASRRRWPRSWATTRCGRRCGGSWRFGAFGSHWWHRPHCIWRPVPTGARWPG